MRRFMVRAVQFLILAGATVARADDGVIEVSQGMMPLTISESGSYRLTENLVGTNGANGITVTTNDVQIDLAGFSLRGVAGARDGIVVPTNLSPANLVVKNGSIVNWGGRGVSAVTATNCTFSGLLVGGNVYDTNMFNNSTNIQTNAAFRVGPASSIIECRFLNNGGRGAEPESGATVLRCEAVGNRDHGFDVHSSSVVEDCAARENGHDGFHLSHAVTARSLTAIQNGTNIDQGVGQGAGVEIDTGSIAVDCLSRGNGDDGYKSNGRASFINCVSEFNSDDGFDLNENMYVIGCRSVSNGVAQPVAVGKSVGLQIGSGSTVIGCTIMGNGNGIDYSGGIRLNNNSIGCRFERNVSVGNNPNGFYIDGTNNIFVGNMAMGNLTNNYFASGSNQMPVVVSPGGTMPDSPWVNFSL